VCRVGIDCTNSPLSWYLSSVLAKTTKYILYGHVPLSSSCIFNNARRLCAI